MGVQKDDQDRQCRDRVGMSTRRTDEWRTWLPYRGHKPITYPRHIFVIIQLFISHRLSYDRRPTFIHIAPSARNNKHLLK